MCLEKPKEYEDDGQELYLELCKEANQAPIRIFHKGLLTDTIDLRVRRTIKFTVWEIIQISNFIFA